MEDQSHFVGRTKGKYTCSVDLDIGLLSRIVFARDAGTYIIPKQTQVHYTLI